MPILFDDYFGIFGLDMIIIQSSNKKCFKKLKFNNPKYLRSVKQIQSKSIQININQINQSKSIQINPTIHLYKGSKDHHNYIIQNLRVKFYCLKKDVNKFDQFKQIILQSSNIRRSIINSLEKAILFILNNHLKDKIKEVNELKDRLDLDLQQPDYDQNKIINNFHEMKWQTKTNSHQKSNFNYNDCQIIDQGASNGSSTAPTSSSQLLAIKPSYSSANGVSSSQAVIYYLKKINSLLWLLQISNNICCFFRQKFISSQIQFCLNLHSYFSFIKQFQNQCTIYKPFIQIILQLLMINFQNDQLQNNQLQNYHIIKFFHKNQ
ncbi:hypothetical protein pb186bvf_006451 [Paramecium bursaria]